MLKRKISRLPGFWICLLLSQPAAAATFVVDSFLDTSDTSPGDGICEATSGGTQCTLRAAIEEANALAGADEITFSLGPMDVNLSTASLPAISESLVIDGSTAPAYNDSATQALNAPPAVYIDGDGLVGAHWGLRVFTTQQVEIIAIGVTGFSKDGILVANSSDILLDSNWIGTTRGGSIKGNGEAGINFQDSHDCVAGQEIVGTSIRGRGNVIGNNGGDGIYISSGSGEIIGGNFIGVDPIGSSDHGNGGHGIHTFGTAHQIGQIRSTAPALETGNWIGNNGGDGVHVAGYSTLLANYIFENDGNGMWLSGDDTLVGNVYDHARNILEANSLNGILITDGSAVSRVEVRNNWVFAHPQRGIQVENGIDINLIENAIWDNLGDAIYLDAHDSDVWGNRIGTAANGSGNGGSGIVIDSYGNSVSGNDIGGVDGDGIDVVSGAGNELRNNHIGTDDAFADFGNTGTGIRVRAAAESTWVDGNHIGHNGASGILNQGAGATEISNNFIGSGPAGQAMANGGSGINITAASTDAQITRNVIGHNLLDGILLDGGSSQVCSNWIGVGQGYEDAGNAVEGIRLRGSNNRVGDLTVVCGGNRIGFNNSDGIQAEGDSNIIRDNFLGGIKTDTIAVSFENGQGGVLLTAGAASNTVRGNYISYNGDHGVRVGAAAGNFNAIRMNEFFANAGMAIDLQLDGPTPNDAGDNDTGPNKLQNTPEFDSVQAVGSELNISYRVNSNVGPATYPITVDFYVSLSNERQGQWVRQSFYTVAPNTPWQAQFEPGIASGYVMAMATDADGNSSEFSAPVAFEVQLPNLIFGDGFED